MQILYLVYGKVHNPLKSNSKNLECLSWLKSNLLCVFKWSEKKRQQKSGKQNGKPEPEYIVQIVNLGKYMIEDLIYDPVSHLSSSESFKP